MTLKASKIVVVGGSSGIGRGVATAVLDRGADVVLVARSHAKLQETSKALGSSPRVTAIAADVTREEDVRRMFAAVGSFDHLVITRGVPPVAAPIASFDLGAVRAFIETMLVSAISLAKHAQRTLRVGGSMILTSGISKDRPSIPGGTVVAAIAGSLDTLPGHWHSSSLRRASMSCRRAGWILPCGTILRAKGRQPSGNRWHGACQ